MRLEGLARRREVRRVLVINLLEMMYRLYGWHQGTGSIQVYLEKYDR